MKVVKPTQLLLEKFIRQDRRIMEVWKNHIIILEIFLAKKMVQDIQIIADWI